VPTSRSQAVAAAAGAAYAATRSDEVGEVARTAGRQAIDAVSAAKSTSFPGVCSLSAMRFVLTHAAAQTSMSSIISRAAQLLPPALPQRKRQS
jgi:hypothetical protein